MATIQEINSEIAEYNIGVRSCRLEIRNKKTGDVLIRAVPKIPDLGPGVWEVLLYKTKENLPDEIKFQQTIYIEGEQPDLPTMPAPVESSDKILLTLDKMYEERQKQHDMFYVKQIELMQENGKILEREREQMRKEFTRERLEFIRAYTQNGKVEESGQLDFMQIFEAIKSITQPDDKKSGIPAPAKDDE
jgi:hypothetical protein